jgi:hypothetical protein
VPGVLRLVDCRVHCEHDVSDLEIVGIAERNGRKTCDLHLDQGNVSAKAAADEMRLDLPPILERHRDPLPPLVFATRPAWRADD